MINRPLTKGEILGAVVIVSGLILAILGVGSDNDFLAITGVILVVAGDILVLLLLGIFRRTWL